MSVGRGSGPPSLEPGEAVSRWRLLAGVGVVAVLALTLIVSVQQGSPPFSSPTTTLSAASTPTTTPTTSTTTPPTSPSTTSEQTTSTTNAEHRLAEVEALLQDLWLGWFDAIYRKDPDALWRVVATTRNHDAGVAAMDTMDFTAPPSVQSFQLEDLEILLDRPDCLVTFYQIDASVMLDQPPSQFVSVMWPHPQHGFRFASDWRFPNDLWAPDCNELEREATP